MKVQVIGLGIVGNAQAYLCKQLGHDVYGYDINCATSEYAICVESPILNVDITFICTPENTVEAALQKLLATKVRGLYAIKSTVPVGTTQELMKKYGVHICHNPEFLREAHALEDVMHPSRVVIGECCPQHGSLLEKLYAPLDKPIFRTNPVTSEMIKLASNSLRAVNISFWNELYMLCQKIGADIKKVAEAADPAKVLGEWEGGRWGTKFFGKPYDGKCLPKDIKYLITAFKNNGLNPTILEASEQVNRGLNNDH